MYAELSSKKLHSVFAEKIREISGEDVLLCYQCATCSGDCPMSFSMDLLPHQVMRFAQLGMEEELRKARTPWICASCFTCTVRCPRGLDIARVMEAIRLITLRSNVDYIKPREIPQERLSELPQIALVGAFRKHTA